MPRTSPRTIRTFPCAVVWHSYGTPYGYQRRCGSNPSRDLQRVSACLRRPPTALDAVINAATRGTGCYPYSAVPAVQRMVVYSEGEHDETFTRKGSCRTLKKDLSRHKATMTCDRDRLPEDMRCLRENWTPCMEGS